MPPGASKKSKCRCRPHEIPDRYELKPIMGSLPGREGFEAVHRSTVGERGAIDSEILDFAASGGWIVFTPDLDLVCCSRPADKESQCRSGSTP